MAGNSRNRKQAATVSSPTPQEQATLNGNGVISGAKEEVYERENIFLFYPNLIGKSVPVFCNKPV